MYTSEDTSFTDIFTRITHEFSYELETCGQWKWALYVLLFLESSPSKTSAINKLLEKHADDEEGLRFAVDSLKIPPTYIHRARGTLFKSQNKLAHAFNQFVLAKEY